MIRGDGAQAEGVGPAGALGGDGAAAPGAEPTLERVRAALVDPASESGGYLSLMLVLALALFAQASGGWGAVMVFAVVVVARDLACFMIMRALQAVDSRALMMPLASGRLPVGHSPMREAAIIFASPLSLMAISLAAVAADRLGAPGARDAALLAASLAGFFLLPLKPYDGWRVLNLCLFSRWAAIEAAVAATTSVALAALGVWLEAWVLAAVGALQLLGIGLTLKVARAAAAVEARFAAVPKGHTRDLEVGVQEALYAAVMAELGELLYAQGKKNPAGAARSAAIFMRDVHARAGRVVPSPGVTVLLLVGYAALVTYFVVALVIAQVVLPGAAEP